MGNDTHRLNLVAKNRFEQVDELQLDAINLTLIQRSDGQVGVVRCPKTAAPDRLPADLTTLDVPIRDAVIGAIQLANSKKISIVVIDREHLKKRMGRFVAVSGGR